MTRPMHYPVVGSLNWGLRVVATFFDYGSAVDFINAERGERTLYLGTPQYDRRTSGYRFTPQPVGQTYQEWLAEVDGRRAAA